MGFGIKAMQSNAADAMINQTRNRYQEFYEGIIDNNQYESGYLQELLQLEQTEPGSHQEAIALQKEVFEKGEKSELNFKQKIQRMDDIAAQKKKPSFCIAKETTKAEIKTLMTEIELALKNTKDPAEIQFLRTISETAETCKDNISNGVAFDDQYIPLLKNEQKYAQTLISNITHKKLNDLIQDSSVDLNANSAFLSTIKDIYNQTVNSKNILGLMDKEHDFMKTLQAEIESVVNNPSSSLQDTSERLKEALHTKVNALLENDSTTNNFVSEGFKNFINHVCKAIRITSPFSKAAEAKQDIIQKFEDLKQIHQENITPSPNIEEAEDTDENTPQNPAV
ncbi:MAG: hypothetical protein P1U36_07140 [Legionellaceae bacterium]|nr:hypothetical protein [Legionellaceae bacterium]